MKRAGMRCRGYFGLGRGMRREVTEHGRARLKVGRTLSPCLCESHVVLHWGEEVCGKDRQAHTKRYIYTRKAVSINVPILTRGDMSGWTL